MGGFALGFGFGATRRGIAGVTSNLLPSVAAKAWGATVYNLGGATTGYRATPTKIVGTDTLPTGASITSGTEVTLAGSGGTFSGWDVTGRTIKVTAGNWIIEDCKFHLVDTLTYAVQVTSTGADCVIRYNLFDAEYGTKKNTVYTAGARTLIRYNKGINNGTDWIKFEGAFTGANQPIAEYNYIEVGGWNNDLAHFDAMTVAQGDATIRYNHFNLTAYVPASGTGSFTPARPRNISVNGVTYGLTNAVRVHASTGAVGTVTVQGNIFRGHKRGGANIFQIAASTGGVANVIYDDNLIEEAITGGIMYPGYTVSGAVTWSNNTRWSDGAAFTTESGDTAGAPSAPVLVGFSSIAETTAVASFDAGGDADSHQYRYSTDAGVTWSAAATFSTTNGDITLEGLPSGTAMLVQLRGVNTSGNGAWSNSVALETVAVAGSAFAIADNQGAAYSRVSSAWTETAIRRMVFVWKATQQSAPSAARNILGTGTNTRVQQAVTTGILNFRVSSTTIINATSSLTPTTGQPEIHMFTVDLTVAGTEGAGAVGDVVKHYVLRADGTFQVATMTGLADTTAGARVINATTTYANLDFNAANGTSINDNGLHFVGVDLGDNTLALPAPTDAASMLALFSDTNAPTTLAAWDVAYWSDAATGVGTSDGTTANTWNATGGLTNRGTKSGKPLVKQAGTYLAA